jgi:LysM repeat protein
VDFDDLYQNGRKRNLSGGKKLRFCCIFFVVAIVTGLVIWLTLPRSSVKAVPENTKNQPAASAEEKHVPEKTTGVPESPKRKVEKKKALPSGKKVSNPVAVREPVLTPRGQGGIPQKGIPGKGDISPDSDKPVIPEEEKKTDAETSGKIAELEQLFRQKNFSEVSRRGNALMENLTMGSLPFRKVLSLLTQANWQRFLNRDTTDDFAFRHTVKSGDQLGVIARKNHTTVAALMKANKIKRANLIQIGQKLTVLKGEWGIYVYKNFRLLILMKDAKFFAGFDIGVGRDNKTPSEDFIISERLKHPVYRTSDGRIFKHGEKENQLGDYFLKMNPSHKTQRQRAGFGIHGTPDETTVTRSLSNGCIRMRNADVEMLYHLVPSGTRVCITD